MIPQLVSVRRRRRWLHVPVLPVVLLLSPLLVLVLLAGLVACLVYRVPPVGAVRGAGRVLCALPGTRLDMEFDGTAVQIHVR